TREPSSHRWPGRVQSVFEREYGNGFEGMRRCASEAQLDTGLADPRDRAGAVDGAHAVDHERRPEDRDLDAQIEADPAGARDADARRAPRRRGQPDTGAVAGLRDSGPAAREAPYREADAGAELDGAGEHRVAPGDGARDEPEVASGGAPVDLIR